MGFLVIDRAASFSVIMMCAVISSKLREEMDLSILPLEMLISFSSEVVDFTRRVSYIGVTHASETLGILS